MIRSDVHICRFSLWVLAQYILLTSIYLIEQTDCLQIRNLSKYVEGCFIMYCILTSQNLINSFYMKRPIKCSVNLCIFQEDPTFYVKRFDAS